MGDEPILTPRERAAVNAGRWFSRLAPEMRHDLLRHAKVRRFKNGEKIEVQALESIYWIACARGAVRLLNQEGGELVFFSYVAPGEWFGDIEVFGGTQYLYSAYAHGNCTIMYLSRDTAWSILRAHPALYGALAWLQARRTRKILDVIDDLKGLSLRGRLAKQLVELVKRFGVGFEKITRIDLKISQSELANLLGASRQRINLELKTLKKEGIIETGSHLFVLNFPMLLRISKTGEKAKINPALVYKKSPSPLVETFFGNKNF